MPKPAASRCASSRPFWGSRWPAAPAAAAIWSRYPSPAACWSNGAECCRKGCGAVEGAYGCARIYHEGNLCVIELPEDAPDWALAHEFKHCFGYVHKHEARPQLAEMRR